jgi:hypothetical protein
MPITTIVRHFSLDENVQTTFIHSTPIDLLHGRWRSSFCHQHMLPPSMSSTIISILMSLSPMCHCHHHPRFGACNPSQDWLDNGTQNTTICSSPCCHRGVGLFLPNATTPPGLFDTTMQAAFSKPSCHWRYDVYVFGTLSSYYVLVARQNAYFVEKRLSST